MEKTKIISFICSCGCKAQMQIQKVDGIYMVDTREDGRKRWKGVILKLKNMKKLQNFVKSIT